MNKRNITILLTVVFGFAEMGLYAVKSIITNSVNQQLSTVQMQVNGALEYNTYISAIDTTFWCITAVAAVAYLVLLFIFRSVLNEKNS